MRLARILEDARQQAKLSAAVMSSMVGIDEARLCQLEAGEDEPTAVELDTYARVFGLRMAELAGGQATGAPLTRMLF